MSEKIVSLHDFLSKHPMYQRSLADLLGVTVSAVNKWSSGDRAVTKRTAIQLTALHEQLTRNPEMRKQYVVASPGEDRGLLT